MSNKANYVLKFPALRIPRRAKNPYAFLYDSDDDVMMMLDVKRILELEKVLHRMKLDLRKERRE